MSPWESWGWAILLAFGIGSIPFLIGAVYGLCWSFKQQRLDRERGDR